MLRVRASHNQTSAFKIDEDRLHGLRCHEGRAGQLGIRNSRIAGNGKQDCILRCRDADPSEFGIQALPQSMLSDLQVVANPIDSASRCKFRS